LGQQVYGSCCGIAVVLKDDQILTVGTTGLPARLGANDRRRSDLAHDIASAGLVATGCSRDDRCGRQIACHSASRRAAV
jgi:hypothetical protein